MARFYGTVQGVRGEATRLGHASSGLRVTAQSYSGDVCIRLYANGDIDCVEIQVEGHGCSRGKTIYRGPIRDLLEDDARRTMLHALVQEELVA